MRKESENYLRMSLEDLESSRILYVEKKYPQSIFFLQQSVEKVTKGITGIFERHHRTLNIYKSLVDKKLKKDIKLLEETPVDNEKTFLSFMSAIKSLLSKIDSGRLNLKVGRISILNFPLQHILSSHVNSTRYPQGEYNPITRYTNDYFLIKYYYEIYYLQKKCLDECFKFFSPRKS